MNGITGTLRLKKNGAAEEKKTKTKTAEAKMPYRQFDLEKKESAMSTLTMNGTKEPRTASQSRQERRGQRRASVKVLARIRPADSKDERFEEILGTLNASRANLYVITTSQNYYKHMSLRVTFPYDSAHDTVSISEDLAEVVRLDHRSDGRMGVAIQFRKSNAPAPSHSTSTARGKGERRFAVRHAVSAGAKATEVETRLQLQARCSDLSVAGCYIDTLNPFPVNSKVQLHLTYKDTTFEVNAHVVTHHVGMGMGLVFDKLGPEQVMVLVDWLSKRPAAAPSLDQPFAPEKLPAIPEAAGLTDRALFVKLLRLLEANGKLTHSEISTLLSESVTV
jgi:hypothetical protein